MKFLATIIAIALSATLHAQDYIESFSHNKNFRGVERTLQYRPTDDGRIVCHNGSNLYTRALYGSNTLFRVETSDRPIFAAYHKTGNRNIHFELQMPGKTPMRLDSTATCTAWYRGGERSYLLTDPSWGKARLELTAVSPTSREAALWQVKAYGFPKGTILTANTCATIKIKINRSGDMGADPANCFAPDADHAELRTCTLGIGGKSYTGYVEYADRDITAGNQKALRKAYDEAQSQREALTSRLKITTPDPYFNTLGASIMAGADGTWDGQTWQHGAIGWRMPLSGWRGAYMGDFLGWHDRARTHFDAYATSQVKDVEPVIPHPTQDPKMAMARAEKKWGTQMYSNGYICRNPGRNNQMHHYDMNLCYIDELLWHFCWTGDTAYARTMWPVIKAHLAWEKRNYDPDNDGLYDAYCCIWASDALYYNSGSVTHSTAYNYRGNKLAAAIAEMIGEDPEPYRAEAAKILNALNSTLWMPNKGVWAEFKDRMGHGMLHDHPAVWTVYHAIDSDVADPFQAYSATRYIDKYVPHIPVEANGLDRGEYATIATTDWMPYAWSINNVAFAEVMHTCLAYWQAGRTDEAAKLFKSSILDGMYIGNSPGNVGQISYYDAARGECYRDFADPLGVISRCVVQGLYGFTPDALNRKLVIKPGFPTSWPEASIEHNDFDMAYTRNGLTDRYDLKLRMEQFDSITFQLPALYSNVKSVTANGRQAHWTLIPESVGMPRLSVTVPAGKATNLVISWAGQPIDNSKADTTGVSRPGFSQLRQGHMTWWMEDAVELMPARMEPQYYGLDYTAAKGATFTPVAMDSTYNASVTDIFRNQYLSPRSPYTTLQLPVQGIGEWCHPLDSAKIDDSFMRAAGGRYVTPSGIPFITPAQGHNIAYTSLYDNYPDSISVSLNGKAKALHLMLAGSTNHMQCHMTNAIVKAEYTDGSTTTMPLIPPINWCPIEQDYYADGKAFRLEYDRPQRLALQSGVLSTDMEHDLGISGVYGRRIPGGAATLLRMPVDATKELKAVTLTTHANEVVAGIMAVTLEQ